jgi:hypothetical protein
MGVLACALAVTVPARAEGPGIKLGDRLVLHLGLGAVFHYEDNIFLAKVDKTDAFVFALTPSIDLLTRGGGSIDFRLHAGMTYNEYLASTKTGVTRDAIAQHRSFAVDAGASMTLFPRGKFNLTLFDNFVRTTQLPYTNLPFNLDRDSNQLGFSLRVLPGGGRLVLTLGFVWALDFFEPSQLQAFNLFSYGITLNVAWKFFPKTSLYLTASETIIQYRQHADFNRTDSYPFHVELGVMGLITPKLSVNAWVGYGNGFYAAGNSPNTAVGGLALTWKPSLLSIGSIGYRYDFANALLGAFYNSHQVYISWTQLIWRFTAFARLSYQNITYEEVPCPQGGVGGTCTSIMDPDPTHFGSRTDNGLSFDLRLDYPFKPYLIGTVGYNLLYNTTNSPGLFGGPTVPIYPLGYTANDVWLQLLVLY